MYMYVNKRVELALYYYYLLQGDLLASGGPHEKQRQTKLTQLKRKERVWVEEMKVNEPGRSSLAQRRNSWQRAKHAWLYSDLLQALFCQLWVVNISVSAL